MHISKVGHFRHSGNICFSLFLINLCLLDSGHFKALCQVILWRLVNISYFSPIFKDEGSKKSIMDMLYFFALILVKMRLKRVINCILCSVRMLFHYVCVTNGFPNSNLEIFQSKMLRTANRH